MSYDTKTNTISFQVLTHLARIVLITFLLTFVLTRIIVFLIMSRQIPDLYLYLRGTHIHHLNYGIFLLAGVGAYLLFRRPIGRNSEAAAVVYGIGMALTFDEFGMWVHLGGSYWQRASWDAITVLSAMFSLIAFAPSFKRFRPYHWRVTVVIVVSVVIFFLMLFESFQYADKIIGSELQEIGSPGPP
jgi:hypothetical protein